MLGGIDRPSSPVWVKSMRCHLCAAKVESVMYVPRVTSSRKGPVLEKLQFCSKDCAIQFSTALTYILTARTHALVS